MSKFRIISQRNRYQPQTWSKDTSPFVVDGIEAAVQDGSPDAIVVSADAVQTLFGHIAWGQDIRSNQNEQGGILVGRAYSDAHAKTIYGIVDYTIAAVTANGQPAYVRFSHEDWHEMLKQVDTLMEEGPDRGLQVIGWYHTHPGNLSVFMSGTDRTTQRKMFSEEWQFAIVLNPQRKTWRAFRGVEARECQGILIKP